MAESRYSTKRLLALRRLTRAAADLLRSQVKEHLTTLTPLFRPRVLLGDHVQGGAKESTKGADTAFKELQTLYAQVAAAKPFGLPTELKSPLNPLVVTLELSPLEYSHAAKQEGGTKTIAVTAPFKNVLTYSGYSPKRLRGLLADPNRSHEELHQFLVHILVLHLVVTRQSGLAPLLAALGCPVETVRLPEFGSLPVTCLGSTVASVRPPDEVVIESTELAGMDAFEEVADIDQINNLGNALKDQLIELINAQSPDLLKPA